MSSYSWQILQETTSMRNSTKEILTELQELKETFQENTTATPSIIREHRRKTVGDEFIKYGEHTAISLISTGDDIQQLFKLDFKHQLATVITLQDNKICNTETKKLSDIPRKMVQNAQQAIKKQRQQRKLPANNR